MRPITLEFIAAALMVLLLTQRAEAQTATVPVRKLEVTAAADISFASLQGVHQIGANQLAVHDPTSRRLVVVDTNLVVVRVVLDSAGIGASAYGGRPSRILRYTGDSLLFVDAAAATLVMFDPLGRSVRAIAGPPSRTDMRGLTVSASYIAGDGSLVFKQVSTPRPRPFVDPRTQETTLVNTLPDSAAIVRFRFDTRVFDTVTTIRQASVIRTSITRAANGDQTLRVVLNPVEQLDDWTVLANGTVIVLRGHDYHAEVYATDGTHTRGLRLPFAWKRLGDAEKQALLDSTRAAWRELERRAFERGGAANAMDELQRALIAAFDPTASSPPPPRSSTESTRRSTFVVEPVSLAEVPDFLPPFRRDALLPDRRGNVWILPTTTAAAQNGELVYDVVSPQGVLVERVQVPRGRIVVGFGHGDSVILGRPLTDKRWALERAAPSGDR